MIPLGRINTSSETSHLSDRRRVSHLAASRPAANTANFPDINARYRRSNPQPFLKRLASKILALAPVSSLSLDLVRSRRLPLGLDLLYLEDRTLLTVEATITTISSSSLTSAYGKPLTLTAAVSTLETTSQVPTGTVTFQDGITNLGSGTLSVVNGVDVATFTVSSLSVDTHYLKAIYNGDTNNISSTSANLTQTISKGSSTLTLTSSATATTIGNPYITLNVTVNVNATGSNQVDGTLSATDNGISLPSTIPISGVDKATLQIPYYVTEGAHHITLMYGGNANNLPSNTASIDLTGAPQQYSNTTVTSIPKIVQTGQPVTLTAFTTIASGYYGSLVDSRPGVTTIQFFDGDTLLGSEFAQATTLPTGAPAAIATLTTSTLSEGVHQITAVYSGSSDFAPSRSPVLSLRVAPNPNANTTTTTITSSSSPSQSGKPVTFTANVNIAASGAGIPTGTVTFKDGDTVLDTVDLTSDNNGTAVFSTSSLPAGTHQITAVYSGDYNNFSSTSSILSQTVTSPPATSTTLTSSSPTTLVGSQLTFTATVEPEDSTLGSPTGSITFKDGSKTLAVVSLNGGKAVLLTSALAAGTHQISATYSGDLNNATSVSSALTQVITKNTTSTSLTSSNLTSRIGETITLAANVKVASPGTGTPTGTVTFMDGNTTLAVVTLNNGVATFSTSSLALGTHQITATYAGDSNNLSGVSSALTQIIKSLVPGDYNSDGLSDVALYVPGQDKFTISYLNANGQSIGQNVFNYGYHVNGVYSIPIAGDFNGDGINDVGLYFPTLDKFAVDYLGPNGKSIGQAVFNYGYHVDGVYSVPITGDFNGDGRTDIGIYLPTRDKFAIDYLGANGQSIGQNVFNYGYHTGGVYSVPLVGDFNGDGKADVGIYLPTQDKFALDYLGAPGTSIGQNVFNYGYHADGVYSVPITGDFNGDGRTDIGIYLPTQDKFALNYLGAPGTSIGQNVFNYGYHTGGVYSVPLVGDFNGDGRADVGIYLPTQDKFALDYLGTSGASVGQAAFNYGYHTTEAYSTPISAAVGSAPVATNPPLTARASYPLVIFSQKPAANSASPQSASLMVGENSGPDLSLIHDSAIGALAMGSETTGTFQRKPRFPW